MRDLLRSIAAVLGIVLFGNPAFSQTLTHFVGFTEFTGNFATLGVPTTANPNIAGTPLASGDEIGVFTPNGLLVGAVVWLGSNTAITVWGDNSQTAPVDGIIPGQTMSLRVWRQSTNTEYSNVSVSYIPGPPYQNDGVYVANGIYLLSSLIVSVPSATSVVNTKVFLQGPFSGGAMTSALNTSGQIPLTSESAYAAATYGYTASAVASIPNTGIVDWLLVELRSDTAGATKAAARAGFLKSDGTVVDIDGTSPLSFTGVSPGNYYIVIRHRNHLAIMSSVAVALSSTTALYDFTTAQTQAYGTDAMAALTGGAFGMIAGDVNQDGVVKYNLTSNDRALIYVRIGADGVNTTVSGYYPEDVNLDGIVKYNLGNNDRAIIYVNVGGGSVNATVSTKVPK